MAFYALYALGLAICLLGAWLLYKQVSALKTTMAFQKNFLKSHSEAIRFQSDQGWMWIDVLLPLLSLSAATQAQSFLTAESSVAPEMLCFIGIAIFCASRAVSHANDGRMVFYPQGFIYHDEDIPYSSVRSLVPAGNQVEVKTRKTALLISKKQASEVEKRMKEWKKAKHSR